MGRLNWVDVETGAVDNAIRQANTRESFVGYCGSTNFFGLLTIAVTNSHIHPHKGSKMRIRQIALVAKDMQPVKEALLGLLGLQEAHIDPKIITFGLQNVVMALGDTFLEVVSPVEEGTTAGRLLERRGGDGGYMVIVQVDDLASEKERLATTPIRIIWQTDSVRAKAVHLHPKDVPGVIASLDQMIPPEAWHWAGSEWPQHKAQFVKGICGAEVQTDDPTATAEQWSLAYAHPIVHKEGSPTLSFGSTEVRFVAIKDQRGPGLRAIDVMTTDLSKVLDAADQQHLPRQENTVEVCGITINFIEHGPNGQ